MHFKDSKTIKRTNVVCVQEREGEPDSSDALIKFHFYEQT